MYGPLVAVAFFVFLAWALSRIPTGPERTEQARREAELRRAEAVRIAEEEAYSGEGEDEDYFA